jgi:hypothetical protein
MLFSGVHYRVNIEKVQFIWENPDGFISKPLMIKQIFYLFAANR